MFRSFHSIPKSPAFRSPFLAVFLAASMIPSLTASPAMARPEIAIDMTTGLVVEHHDAFQRWYPASLTKLMTAYVTFRAIKSGRLSLKSPVIMTEEAASEPPGKMYFEPGVGFTIDSALKYILIKSANDVAVALAQAVAGSTEAFVDTMNAEAWRIGMTSSKFVNPHGLPEDGQYTTARDMALLAIALRREFPQFASYFDLEGFSLGEKEYPNHNILIGRFDGANGMKTGFICASGFNLVSSATRNGKTVIAVVLGAESQKERAEESARLLHKALTGARGTVPLAMLKPYGEGRSEVADISDQICTPEARKARYDGYDVDGKIVLDSPYLSKLNRERQLAAAPTGIRLGDGPASAIEAAIVLGVKAIPLPVPRPTL